MYNNLTGYKMFEKLLNFRDSPSELNKNSKETDEQYEKRLNEIYNRNDKKPFELSAKLEGMIVRTYKSFTDGSPYEKLIYTFKQLYDFIIEQDSAFDCFYNDDYTGDDEFDACVFTALCMFIHNSTRIEDISLTDFVHKHSNVKYEYKAEYESEVQKLKDYRRKIFTQREVYNKPSKWHSITADMEFEWTLFYEVIQPCAPDKRLLIDNFIDTYKSIGNLNNHIITALNEYQVTKNWKKYSKAYGQYISKLKKIKYSNYYTLNKVILERLNEEKLYYGINLYRLENELGLYVLSNSVNKLKDASESEYERIMMNYAVMSKKIVFSKVYDKFGTLPLNQMDFHVKSFQPLLDAICRYSKLILDSLIEKDFFEEDWHQLFCGTINVLADTVLYKPHELEVDFFPDSQRLFEELVSVIPRLAFTGKL